MRVLFMVLIMVSAFAANTFSQANSAQQYFKKGTELAEAKKHEQAIESYEKALEVRGNSKEQKARIQYNIGACLYQLEKFNEAEKAFTKAVKLSKNRHAQAVYSLGLTQIELEKPKYAEANFRKVIRLDKSHAEAWFDLGMVLLERKMFDNAKIAFEKSIEYKTTRVAEAQNNLGVISAVSGNIQLARTQFLRAFLQSGGKLLLAKENLEYWKKYGKYLSSNRLAKN